MKIFVAISIVILIIIICLAVSRFIDDKNTQSLWSGLILNAPTHSERFDPNNVAALPEPARRFFLYTLKAGTILHSAVELEMSGEFSLGTKAHPNYMPMEAKQILAAPSGFIWDVSAGKGVMNFIGSDAAHPKGSWTRFWMWGVLPVARLGDSDDHKKSSFGRYMSEAVFWLPSTVLPSHNISWEEVSQDIARVTIKHDGMTLSVDITVNEIGQPIIIEFQRWSNANPEKTFKFQSFGGYLSDFKEFNGYMLPTKVEAGNHFGTDDYFPFYKVNITTITFP